MKKQSKAALMAGVVVAAGALTTGAFAATSNNTTVAGWGDGGRGASAVGPNGQSVYVAAADTFEDDFNDVSGTFYETVVTDIIPMTREQLTANGQNATNMFEMSFKDASVDYDDSVKSALEKFRMQVMAAKNGAESKDQFIDAFNRAKNDYFNSVDAAKNKFADDINRLGGDNNARAKDMFMNKYNMARDMYNNEVEKVKNDFAATIG